MASLIRSLPLYLLIIGALALADHWGMFKGLAPASREQTRERAAASPHERVKSAQAPSIRLSK